MKGKGFRESTRAGVVSGVVSTCPHRIAGKELKCSYKQVKGYKELRYPGLFEGNLFFEPRACSPQRIVLT
jgi:hypothetical protein